MERSSCEVLISEQSGEGMKQLAKLTANYFHVPINDDELVHVSSVKDIAKLMHQKLNVTASGCTAQHAFYQIRNGIVDITGVNRNNISIKTKLCQVLADTEIGRLYGYIEQQEGICLTSSKFVAAKLFSFMSPIVRNKYSNLTVGELAEKIAYELGKNKRANKHVTPDYVEQKVQEFAQKLFQEA